MVHWFQNTDAYEASTEEREDDSDDVDGELELKELRDAVVDVPSPHDGFHDAIEIVVRQNYIGRLFGNIGSSNALKDTDCHPHQ